jgi:hypothetical protein
MLSFELLSRVILPEIMVIPDSKHFSFLSHLRIALAVLCLFKTLLDHFFFDTALTQNRTFVYIRRITQP